jgi:hypothetical protein
LYPAQKAAKQAHLVQVSNGAALVLQSQRQFPVWSNQF